MMRPTATSSAPRYLPCRLGPVRLAFDVTRLEGIRRSDGIQRNPSADGPIGWLLDDREVPVIDLGVWLGVESRFSSSFSSSGDPGSSRVLVFKSEEGPKGVMVDESGSARDVQQGQVLPFPEVLGNLAPWGFRSLWTADDHSWLVFDPEVPSLESRHPVVNSFSLATTLSSDNSSGADSDSFGSPSPAEDSPAQSPEGGRLLLFSTQQGGGFERPVRFALSMTQVLEVATLPSLDPVPGAPEFVRGLTLWGGQPLVVLDVDRRMGWGSSKESGDRLLVTQTLAGSRIGLIASGASRLLRLPVPHTPGKLSFNHSLVLGVFELEEETIILPDLGKFASFGG